MNCICVISVYDDGKDKAKEIAKAFNLKFHNFEHTYDNIFYDINARYDSRISSEDNTAYADEKFLKMINNKDNALYYTKDYDALSIFKTFCTIVFLDAKPKPYLKAHEFWDKVYKKSVNTYELIKGISGICCEGENPIPLIKNKLKI